MKVQMAGKMTVKEMTDKLAEVVSETIKKVTEENGETGIKSWDIHGADFTIKFELEGVEEAQVLTVEHYAGQSEMFTWLVNMDEDVALSNEDESMYDAWTTSLARGEELEFDKVDTLFDDTDLVLVNEETFSDLSKEIYTFKEKGNENKLVRVYQEGNLIQEYTLLAKDEAENITE